MRIRAFAVIVLACTVATGAACSRQDRAPGSPKNPIKFYFMPLKGEAVFETNAPIIEKFIEENTGLAVETVNAEDFISIVKALGQKRADIAFMNTLGYLLARDWAKAEAHLRYIYGDLYMSYRGEIVARSDGDVEKPEDIDGKTFAFVEPYSASGYLYPLKFLHDRNIKPKETSFAGDHLKAIEEVYTGKVDAAATYHERPTSTGLERDARTELLGKYPDIIAKVKIIALTDEIPNGPIALRGDLPTEVKSKLIGAMLQFARTPEGRKTLVDLYNITGLTIASDADYDVVQHTIKQLGKTIQDMVLGGAPYFRTYMIPGLE